LAHNKAVVGSRRTLMTGSVLVHVAQHGSVSVTAARPAAKSRLINEQLTRCLACSLFSLLVWGGDVDEKWLGECSFFIWCASRRSQ